MTFSLPSASCLLKLPIIMGTNNPVSIWLVIFSSRTHSLTWRNKFTQRHYYHCYYYKKSMTFAWEQNQQMFIFRHLHKRLRQLCLTFHRKVQLSLSKLWTIPYSIFCRMDSQSINVVFYISTFIFLDQGGPSFQCIIISSITINIILITAFNFVCLFLRR